MKDFLKEKFLFFKTRNGAPKVPRKSRKIVIGIRPAKNNAVNLPTFC